MKDTRDRFEIKNTTQTVVPMGGLVKPVGGYSDAGELLVGVPTEDSESGLVVVTDTILAAYGSGTGTFDKRVILTFDPAGGRPEHGDTLGSKEDSVYPYLGNRGFRVYGGSNGAWLSAIRDDADVSGGGDDVIVSEVPIDYVTDVSATFDEDGFLSITKTVQTITDRYNAAERIVDRVYDEPTEIEILNADICGECAGCEAIETPGSEEFSPADGGDNTFTPGASGLYIVECWGPSGDGGQGFDTNTNGGGGGGAYARSELCLEEGVDYIAHVGLTGGNDPTLFRLTSKVYVKADYGRTGGATGGAGGLASNGIGQVKFSGGNGGNPGPSGAPYGGGGGGGGAGATGNGSNGADGTDTTGGAGGAGGSGGGGIGGAGGDAGEDGLQGSDYGGGGGGGGTDVGDDYGAAGDGRNGRILITWGA